MYNDSLFSTNGITFSGIDTSAWNATGLPAVILTTAPGQSFRDNPAVRTTPLTYNGASAGVAITANATINGRGITVAIQNVALSNFQLQLTAGNRTLNTDPGGTGTITCTNMILAGNSISVVVSDITNTYTNCLILQDVNIPSFYGSGAIFDGSLGGSGAAFRYCTLVQPSDTAPSDVDIFNTVGEGGQPTAITNMALYGCTASTNGGGERITAISSMTDSPVSSPPITNLTCNTAYNTTQFVNPTSTGTDFRPASTSTLRNAGTPIVGVTDDISGKERDPTTPTIGCWEYG